MHASRSTAVKCTVALIACLLAPACLAGKFESGDVPPAYLGKSLEGKDVNLTDLTGKAVVVSFWASWCAYCVKELPILHAIQTKAPDHVKVVAVNLEDRRTFEKLASGFESIGMQVTHDPDRRSRKSYGVDGIPHLVIIGKDGKIDSVFRGYGEESLDKIVQSINRAMGATATVASQE